VHLLLVEDDDAIATPLTKGLERQNFTVRREATGLGAVEAVSSAPSPNIVLLDLGLPDIDGYEVCRRIRATSSVPIIVVTARGEEIDRVLGLELGADDYMVKPFGFRELVARINAVLRRKSASGPPGAPASDSAVHAFGEFELNLGNRSLVRGGTDVLLTTQYLEEADQLADHIVIVDHGRVIADGTPTELKNRAGLDVVEVRVRHAADIAAIAEVLAPLGTEPPHIDEPARRVAVPVQDGTRALTEAVRIIGEREIALDDVGLRRPTLDEVFLTLTGAPS
jgi:DNA-binding response OmpR family regulator